MTPRATARVALVALALVSLVVARGAPRLTWENAGVSVAHPPHQGAAGFVGAIALAAAAIGARPRVAAFALGLGALLLAASSAERLAWRVEALEPGLAERSLSGWTRLPWRDVEAVESRPEAVRVRARAGQTIVLATQGLSAADRTRLERTISRRLRELAP